MILVIIIDVSQSYIRRKIVWHNLFIVENELV
jgi:hypothetical protein